MTRALPRRAVALTLLAAPAVAEETPEARARAFLAAYLAPLQRDAAPPPFPWRDWLTAEFRAIWNRASAAELRRGEMFLDANPILDAQDYERPGDVRIERVSGPPDRPEVRASLRAFRSNPRRTTITLVFERERGAWRIRDILTHGADGPPESLRARAARFAAGG